MHTRSVQACSPLHTARLDHYAHQRPAAKRGVVCVQIDPSELSWLGSAICSFTRDSGRFRTVVSPMILEAAKLGAVDTEALEWSEPCSGRVEPGAAVFYVLNVSAAAARDGFVLAATTRKGRVKLLVWEAGDGEEEFWRIVAQAEAEAVAGGHTASMLQLNGRVLEGLPLSLAVRPRTGLARRMDWNFWGNILLRASRGWRAGLHARQGPELDFQGIASV